RAQDQGAGEDPAQRDERDDHGEAVEDAGHGRTPGAGGGGTGSGNADRGRALLQEETRPRSGCCCLSRRLDAAGGTGGSVQPRRGVTQRLVNGSRAISRAFLTATAT